MNLNILQNYLMQIGISLSLSLVLVLIFTPWMIKLGFKLGIVDHPDERRIHKKITPRCGGLAVFIAYSSTIYLLCFVLEYSLMTPDVKQWAQSAIPVSIPIVIIGLIDDRWDLKPIYKLLGQILVGCIAWGQGLNLGVMLGYDIPPLLDISVTIFLYVAAMNAYNLIDGMDGVASGLAAITSLGLGALNLINGNEGMAILCLALTGSCVGFLRYNFHPARIFLGDSGSMYIGFILISLTLVGQDRTTAAVMLIVPLLTMGVPLIDTGLAIWRRSVRKAIYPDLKGSVSGADKDHLHHRLARKGLTQKKVALLLYIIQAVLFGIGLLWVFLQNYRTAIFVIAFFAGSYVVLRYLASLEMNDSGRWIVDGIRKPGRIQLFNGLMPFVDIFILCFSMLALSWLLSGIHSNLSIANLIRETAAPLVGGPLILIWAIRFYRVQWLRARALDFFYLGIALTAGILIGIAISPLPFREDLKSFIVISIVLLFFAVPPMLMYRAFPRLVQDMLHYHDRKREDKAGDAENRVLIYGAGHGYSLITRAESFDNFAKKKNYCLVGLIDDDPYLKGRRVHGHEVLGNIHDVSRIVRVRNVNEILISTELLPVNLRLLMKIAEEENLSVNESILSTKVLRSNPV